MSEQNNHADVSAIAKASWDEAWQLAFGDGMSAGHPLGRSHLDCDTEWADSEVVARIAKLAAPAPVAAPAAPTLFRWKTSWGDWTYRTERPAGWKDLRGFEAYSLSAPEQESEPHEWQINVAGPAGYVRFETFQGETLEDALHSVSQQGFCPAPDEDGFVTMKVKV